MARGKKTGGRDWKKGIPSPNPKGRPPVPPELKEAREYTRRDVELALHHELSRDYRRNTRKRRGTNLDRLIYEIVRKAIVHGDPYRMNFILENLFGKLPSKVELEAKLKGDLAGKSDEELKAIAKAILTEMEGKP